MRVLSLIALTTALLAPAARANLGMTVLPPSGQDGPVTVYYPSTEAEQPLKLPRVSISVAENGAPERGNGRLVVVSHGSGGAPWVHADLARALVEAGFVVALPEHHADNYKDESDPGPDSWTMRPGEVSRAIDAVGRDARFAPLLHLDKVGMYGMSAGGHTARQLRVGNTTINPFHGIDQRGTLRMLPRSLFKKRDEIHRVKRAYLRITSP